MKGKAKTILTLLSAAIIIMIISVTSFRANSTNSSKELIKRAVEIAVVSGEIPDFHLMKDNKNIVVSSENIDPGLLPKLTDVNLIVLSPTEIKERAQKEGEFLYLSFKEVNIGRFSAGISIDNKWAAQDSKKGYLSGGGMTIRFHKSLEKWKENDQRQAWIS